MGQRKLSQFLQLAENLCRQRGVRLTTQRRKVLEIIYAADKPKGAYNILNAMRYAVPGATPPTVYRALDFLLQQGLIHKLETLHAFVGCAHPEHPHSSQFLICSECGGTNELEDEGIARSLRGATTSSGFEPKRRIVELIGTCAGCSQRVAKTKR